MARWFRCSLSVAGPFVCRCLTSCTMLRFHLPLIEPDGRISRIRLSDKDSRCSPTESCGRRSRSGPGPALVQVFGRDTRDSLPRRTLCLRHNHWRSRLTAWSVTIRYGFADRTEAEVVRPAQQHPVELRHLFFRVPPASPPIGQLADPATDRLDLLLRRTLARCRRDPSSRE